VDILYILARPLRKIKLHSIAHKKKKLIFKLYCFIMSRLSNDYTGFASAGIAPTLAPVTPINIQPALPVYLAEIDNVELELRSKSKLNMPLVERLLINDDVLKDYQARMKIINLLLMTNKPSGNRVKNLYRRH
jgi:hypothetical protein